ncbi:two-partner secretion domain-containing protein [Fusobacterium polymorphum]|uniref:two-partner secretion domain-containing protein n=1 Tax=Fusobacterium nucleatum subsp. polymorphum TaxID=76857 RepID=UPI00300AAE25
MRNKVFRKFITIIFLLIYNIEIFAANLVVDPNSKNNTKLDKAANGVPIVNISTPNKNGISINDFSEYNIGKEGQIINNADNVGRSHLGGIINANPNLAPNQAANLVILQVNGSNRSQIEGYLEALSRQKIDVILSNENGLYINNGGTINIKNFTATTGRVNLKDGDFIGIDVERGNIVIGPKGMDGTNANYVELIAKTLELRGNVVTNDLKVVTGSNKIDKKGNIKEKSNVSGDIAIDARNLGGMYANTIKIISTDKGAGVNSDAFIVSKNSKLEITADGKIKVNKVQGKGIDIKGKEYEQKDLAYSDEGISINANKIKLSGTGTQANKQINLNGTVENNTTIYTKEGIKTKGLTNTGVVQAIKKVEVEGNLTNKGEILTNGSLTAKDTISTKKLIAKDGISVGKLENSGIVVTNKKLDIKGNLTNKGELQAIGNIVVSGNVNNNGEILTNNSFSAKDVISTKKLVAKNGITTNKLENKGTVATNKDLNVKSNLINTGKIEVSNNILVKKDLENRGSIVTNKNLNIDKDLINSGNIQAVGKISVTENTNNKGEILTNSSFSSKDTLSTKKLIAKDGISVAKLENSGIVATDKKLDIKDNLINKGAIQAIGKISVTNNVDNSGEILTNSSFSAKDVKTINKLMTKDDITISKLENSGTVISNKKLNIDGSLTNSGEIQTLDDINIKENIVNTGEILTNGALTSKDVKNDKVISVSKDINIGKLDNKGKLSTAKNLNIDGKLTNLGAIQAVENISVTNNVLNKGTILTNGSFTSKNIKNEKNLSANKDITVSKLENIGNIASNNKITINGVLTNTGELKALDNIKVSGNTTNNGSILTNKNFITKNLNNTKKLIVKEKIDVKNLKNSGTIASGNKFTVNGNLENTNNLETENLDVTGNKITNSGNIKANNISTKVTNIKNDGKILAFNNISFSNAKNISNTKEIIALKDITANNTNLVNNGNIASNGKIILNNANITNTKKISSSTVEMKENKKFSNSGEIIGNNVTLTTRNDINLVGKLHGAQNLTISGKNIVNNGETTGTGTTTITASNNFTNNKDLSAQVLKVNARGNIVNNSSLNGGTVNVSGKNIENNDLIAAAGNVTLTATNKVDNKAGKAIYAGADLNITAKEILNNKDSELLGSNIELTANKVRNEVGTIKASYNILIKTDKLENIGEVKDLDKYEKYYETWDGKILKENEIDDWKRIGGDYSKNKEERAKKAHVGDYIRDEQKDAYEKITNKVENDKYKSLLFPKYKGLLEGYLGNEGGYTEKTGSAKIQDIPLKEKVRALSKTKYGQILAGGDITIQGKNGGNSKEVINKDARISAGNTVKIETDKLKNIVSVGEKIKVKTGQESMYIKFEHTGKKPRKKIRMEVTYTRDLIDANKVAYVTASPSVIEGKNVVINPISIEKQKLSEANGEINQGKENNVEIAERKVFEGIKKEITKEKINSNKNIKQLKELNVKDELKKYGDVGTNGSIYNGNSGINGQIAGSTKVIDDIIKNGKIDTDASLSSALFIKNISPDSKYVLETRLKYINQNSFYGSDYFLKRIGYEEKWNRVKRLGDAYYENELIERSITEKLGTRFLNGKEISVKDLMDNAASIAKKNGLTIGKPLTKEQIAKLDKDIVWYEYQNVDGIQVLAPKVYLSQNTLKNLNTDTRSRITGIENTYVRTGNLENRGLIGGYGNTYVEAKDINNKTLGSQLAEIQGNNTTVIAQNSINNIGARISGNKSLNLVAIDGDIVNKSTVEKIEFNNGEFDRSKFTKIDSIGEIVSNGNLNILTNNYTSIGAITQAKNVNINVTNNINIKSQEVSGEQKLGENDSQYNYYGFERNIGSSLKAEKLNVTANNLNISGSAVATKTADLNVKKLNIESKVDKEDEIRKSSYKDLLKSGSKKETIHNEENSAGSLYVENKGIIRGDVNLVGSNLVLGDNSFVAGKLTTDSRELRNSYSLEEKKKGFSGGIGSGGFSIGYGKSESKLKEKDLTNAKSNLVLGDGTSLNKGADITATNLIHGNISINNGDVKFGARKDVKDVETSSKSSGINLSVRIKSQALDRAKQGVDSFKQMKSGDILGGIASSTNTVTGLVQGLSSNITKKDGSKATLKDIKDGDFKVNNNFYANAGVNLGFNKSSSNSNSHSESGVVTTIRGKDKNSIITYNNVKNIEYIGTQAQNTKFIYNNVDNITKKAVELNNYSSSSSKSSGVSAGVTINYNNGFQAEADAIRVSASKSKMNTNGTTYQNGLFVNVDEVHNNTKNMTLSGFNQIGGTVTGNIQNLTIESKQNTSTTTGSTKGGSIGFAPNGMPNSISANYSQTNGERKYVDDPTTFIIGDGSNLKVGKVENTAGAIGATGNGKLSIDEYIGHNLENKDETKTKGASLSLSPSSTPVSGVGINYANRDLESVTKNTVVGNVSIGKSSGDEINKDIASMTEVTKDEDTKTNIFIESQTIKYALNPSQFKEDLQIAIIEGKATGRTVVKTIDNMINGDKSQDIGDAEKRSLIEIKEAIVRVQTAPAMDIIAEKDLADKNIQARLGVEIEKFDPNDPTLSEKVRERINELKAEGKEIVAFYDKVTKKIFINQNAKDDEVRASIAREYKIKEDLELGRGKENDKGQLRSTVAGEIAYDEIKDRLKKGDKNPISASSFDVAKMGEDSEVTSDKYGEIKEGIGNMTGDAMELSVVASEADINPGILDKDPEKRKKLEQSGKKFEEKYHKNIDYMIEGWHRPEYAERELPILKEKIDKEKNSEMKNLLTARYNYLEEEAHPIRSIKEGFVSGFKEGSADAITLYAASKIPLIGKYVTFGTVVYGGVTSAINASKEEPKIAITFKQANDIKRIAPEFYKDAESSFIIGNKSDVSNSALIGAAEYYYKNNKTPDKRLGNSTGYLTGGAVAYKGISIAESKYNSLKVSTSDINKTVEVAKQNDIGLSQQEGSKHQKGQAPKNQEIVDRLGKGQLDIKKAPGLDTVSEENLIKFQSEVSKSGVKVDLKTGELIGPRGGKGKVVGITPSGKVVANMSGRNVIFENGKQNPVSAGSFKKFEIPKTNEVVEVPSEVIAKNNTKKVSENMFNGFLDKAKSKITGKPVTQVQLERIGIKSEVKDIGLKVDGTTKTGLDIDEALENNLGRTFKTYDSYDKTTKTATSVKSVDMTSKTYTSGSGLNNVLNKYGRAIKDFDEYELKGIYLNKDKIEQNILKIVINNEPLNKSQMENLKKFVEDANKSGIKVEAVILK